MVNQPALLYGFLQIGVVITFGVAAARAWRHSRPRLVELITAFLFGLLLEQGDIFLFGTYRYNENWILLGDVAVAIALAWAMIIVGAMNISDALGLPDATTVIWTSESFGTLRWLVRGLPAPLADAVWAILLDLALDAVAIRLGLWTWTIRLNQGWFGVPWGNFFAWLFVAFWFSFFTRLVRANRAKGGSNTWQWLVPLFSFIGLIVTLVPFVALENDAALSFMPHNTLGADYHEQVWVLFGLTLSVFVTITVFSLWRRRRIPREQPDEWLLVIRLGIHLLFLFALIMTGIAFDLPILLIVALAMFGIELVLIRSWILNFISTTRGILVQAIESRSNT